MSNSEIAQEPAMSPATPSPLHCRDFTTISCDDEPTIPLKYASEIFSISQGVQVCINVQLPN